VSASEPGHEIFLLPLDDAERVPLRRWLGREAWREAPVVSLCYDGDGDRILFRLVDIPSTASGVVAAVHPPDFDGDVFIGFDGTDACAWPTTIALLGFRLHCDEDTSAARIVRELVGDTIWAAALSLRDMAGGESEIRLSAEEAARLIGRWSDLVVGSVADTADDALAKWTAGTAAQAQHSTAAGSPAPAGFAGAGRQAGTTYPYFAALAAAAVGTMSRPPESGRSSVDAGRQLDEPEATGAGVTMARKSPTIPDVSGPVPYRFRDRLSDRWAARRDGKSNVPRLPGTDIPEEAPEERHGITPYMEIRNRHFLVCAERERRRMKAELAETYRTRAEVQQKVVAAEAQVAAVRRNMEHMPEEPADPVRRNVLEQHVHEALVRSRRQKEFQDGVLKVMALEQQAVELAGQLRAEEARLAETIAAREEMLDSQVRELLQHSLRRCGTYMHHIVRHHPDGPAVIPYLKLALPDLPPWVTKDAAPDGGSANGQGAHANGQATGGNGQAVGANVTTPAGP
jgi:hypothetical protein